MDYDFKDMKALREAQDEIMESVEKYVALQNKELDRALRNLAKMKLDHPIVNDEFKESCYYSEGDEDAPFFTEAYLYCLLGKENARTVLAYVNAVFNAAGYPFGTHGVEMSE